jgi:two-component system response regulator
MQNQFASHYYIKGEQGTTMENPTVLLVEDDMEDAVLTLRALMKNNMGDKVYVVRDGVEALDFLFCTNRYADRDPQALPQLALLDLNLPRVNGLEVLRRVRAEEQTRQLPVVILSSSSEEKDLVEIYKNGANSYVYKSEDFFQFVESVQQVSSRWLGMNQDPSE